MHITLCKKQTSEFQEVNVEVESLEKLQEPKSIYLIIHNDLKKDEKSGKVHRIVDIYRVQFIALAKLSISDLKVPIVGFIHQDSRKIKYWLIEVPDGYDQEIDYAWLVDYNSYVDICVMTGLKPKSFNDYIESDEDHTISFVC